MAIVIKAGIGGRETVVGFSVWARRRAIIAWRRRPRSHGIFVSHLFASSIVLSIQRLLEPILSLLMFAVFIGGVEYILLFERGKNLAWIKFFTEKLRNVGRNSRLL
jgi:hypothetical protein